MAIDITTNSEAHTSNAGPPSSADDNYITHGTPTTQPFVDTGMSVTNHKTHYSDKTDNVKIKNKAKPPSAIKRNKERALKHREKKSQQPETKITLNKTTQTAKHSKNAITKIWQRLIICRARNIDQGDNSNEIELKITEVTQKEPVLPDNHSSNDPVNVNNTHLNTQKHNDIANQKQTTIYSSRAVDEFRSAKENPGDERYVGYSEIIGL
ncbi:hypothetical protein FQA39_LY10759 [Lamprigera yunnana]|nr:hypothetical protein FQA39_LY10759 [Lamprigera yunnana]